MPEAVCRRRHHPCLGPNRASLLFSRWDLAQSILNFLTVPPTSNRAKRVASTDSKAASSFRRHQQIRSSLTLRWVTRKFRQNQSVKPWFSPRQKIRWPDQLKRGQMLRLGAKCSRSTELCKLRRVLSNLLRSRIQQSSVQPCPWDTGMWHLDREGAKATCLVGRAHKSSLSLRRSSKSPVESNRFRA